MTETMAEKTTRLKALRLARDRQDRAALETLARVTEEKVDARRVEVEAQLSEALATGSQQTLPLALQLAAVLEKEHKLFKIKKQISKIGRR